jgi:hypothetical protein
MTTVAAGAKEMLREWSSPFLNKEMKCLGQSLGFFAT